MQKVPGLILIKMFSSSLQLGELVILSKSDVLLTVLSLLLLCAFQKSDALSVILFLMKYYEKQCAWDQQFWGALQKWCLQENHQSWRAPVKTKHMNKPYNFQGALNKQCTCGNDNSSQGGSEKMCRGEKYYFQRGTCTQQKNGKQWCPSTSKLFSPELQENTTILWAHFQVGLGRVMNP